MDKQISSCIGTLAVSVDGTLVAFGHPKSRIKVQHVPENLERVHKVCCDSNYSLALLTDGTVRIWKSIGQISPEYNVPDGLSDVVDISCGLNHFVAVRANGELVIWGQKFEEIYAENPIFHAFREPIRTPTNLNTRFVSVSCGSHHSLALTDEGLVVAWGCNTHGQCNVPEDLDSVIQISCGSHHSAALKSDGTVVVWGCN